MYQLKPDLMERHLFHLYCYIALYQGKIVHLDHICLQSSSWLEPSLVVGFPSLLLYCLVSQYIPAFCEWVRAGAQLIYWTYRPSHRH